MVAAPLNHLTRKNVCFVWGPEQQQAFDALKVALRQSPVLASSDPDGWYVLDMDVSKEALGAVLAQVTLEGKKVMAYYSRTFNKAGCNYCVTRKELLAVVDAVSHFLYYLCGLYFTVRMESCITQLVDVLLGTRGASCQMD